MQIKLFVVVALEQPGASEFFKSEIEEQQMEHTYKTISDISSKQKLDWISDGRVHTLAHVEQQWWYVRVYFLNISEASEKLDQKNFHWGASEDWIFSYVSEFLFLFSFPLGNLCLLSSLERLEMERVLPVTKLLARKSSNPAMVQDLKRSIVRGQLGKTRER